MMVEDMIHQIAMKIKDYHMLDEKLTKIKESLKEDVKVLVAEMNVIEKKFKIPSGVGELEFWSRDFKNPIGDFFVELEGEKIRYKAELKPFQKEHKSINDDIKRRAESAGELLTERRWYIKGLSLGGDNHGEED